MVNNFQKIREMLTFPSETNFYFLQILKRRKDNPDLGKDMIHIADYYIFSMEAFNRLEPIIIAQCERENARAYFRINIRDSKKIAFQVLKRVTDYLVSENYNAVKNAYASCSGEFHSDPDKKWIVDIDWKDFEGRKAFLGVLHHRIEELQRETGREPLMSIMPTKNGYHLITRPFNIQMISQFLKDNNAKIDIHKDNPTLLYCI
jgi:hypothetical protein